MTPARIRAVIYQMVSGDFPEKGFKLVGCSVLVAALLTLVACSRSGSLYGDVSVSAPPRAGNPAARLSLRLIPITAGFEQDWTATQAAFREAMAPVQRTQVEAAAALEQARLAWDRALAAPRGRHQSPGAAARERELWRQVRGAEQRLAQANGRVRDVGRTYDLRGIALIEEHTGQLVQTDETGHYLVAALPAGASYLYARLAVGDRTLVWFRRVQMQIGIQRMDLSEASSGGWPFIP
ncbi:MAG TPA: hypothetical protein VLM91_07035 [Candidatus Methylomirabilis sp.]|nr:hypothetical protein [Candidatus Methylomirabilis sp.]